MVLQLFSSEGYCFGINFLFIGKLNLKCKLLVKLYKILLSGFVIYVDVITYSLLHNLRDFTVKVFYENVSLSLF